jgi:hypothetical protein
MKSFSTSNLLWQLSISSYSSTDQIVSLSIRSVPKSAAAPKHLISFWKHWAPCNLPYYFWPRQFPHLIDQSQIPSVLRNNAQFVFAILISRFLIMHVPDPAVVVENIFHLWEKQHIQLMGVRSGYTRFLGSYLIVNRGLEYTYSFGIVYRRPCAARKVANHAAACDQMSRGRSSGVFLPRTES